MTPEKLRERRREREARTVHNLIIMTELEVIASNLRQISESHAANVQRHNSTIDTALDAYRTQDVARAMERAVTDTLKR
jgi:hypothetical protein